MYTGDERTAFARLTELLQLGQLKMVSAVPDPNGAGYPEKDPRHWELKPIVSLVGGTEADVRNPGRNIEFIVAVAADGSGVKGTPSSVLTHCIKWLTYAPATIVPGSVEIAAPIASASGNN